MKVFVESTSYLTTQLYFPASLTGEVYASHADYAPHGLSPYHRGNDIVLGDNPDANGLLLEPELLGESLAATCRLAIA